jgi:ribosomal-protein-alanine N-acetyltransferase
MFIERDNSISARMFLRAKETEDSTLRIGYIELLLCHPEAEVIYIFVDELFRNRGVGNALFREAAAVLAKEGYETLFLEVSESNTNAKKIYEKNGCAVMSVRKNYYGEGDNAVTMRLPLQK